MPIIVSGIHHEIAVI